MEATLEFLQRQKRKYCEAIETTPIEETPPLVYLNKRRQLSTVELEDEVDNAELYDFVQRFKKKQREPIGKNASKQDILKILSQLSNSILVRVYEVTIIENLNKQFYYSSSLHNMTFSLLVIAIIIFNNGCWFNLSLLSLLSFDDTNIHCFAQNAHGISRRNGSSWCWELCSIIFSSSC